MPTDDDRNSNEGNEGYEEAVPPQPTFSLDQVSTMVERAVEKAITATRPRPQPVPRQVEPEPAGADEGDDNVTAIRKEVARALHPLRQEMGQFREFGLDRLGAITVEVEAKKLPYYNDYKSEIDARMAELEPVLRTNPTTLKLVHDTVVAGHMTEITAKARDEGIRQGRIDAPRPGSINGRGVGGDPDVPTMETLGLTEEQQDDINSRGGPDRFAQIISGGRFKNWGDWVKSKQGWDGATKFKGRRIIPFRRMETGTKAS
jgi:hypothetical protein